jgi:hypothetical protein
VAAKWQLYRPAAHAVRRIAAEPTHLDDRAAFGVRPGARGRDPAALRRANPPGAGARADVAVGETAVIGVYFFGNRRRLAVGSV